MAKKEEQEKGSEEYVFEVPDFDEDAFIHKEMVSFKTTGILFVWGVVAALVSWLVFNATGGSRTGWYAGLLIAVGAGFALKFVFPALKADISHFKRKEWIGTGILFFFTWLAVFLLLANPPISDYAPPVVEVFPNPALQQAGGDVTVEAFFIDNHDIKDIEFSVRRGETIIASIDDLQKVTGRGHYQATLKNLTGGTYTYTAHALDGGGHETTTTGSFSVSARAINVELPSDGRIDSALDTILVTLAGDANVRTVYLDLAHSEEHLHLEYDETLGGWKATPNFAGWQAGNNTFTVKAQTYHIDFGHFLVPGAAIDGGTHTLTVDIPTGEYAPKVPTDVTIPENLRRTPGPETALIIIGILGAVAITRRD